MTEGDDLGKKTVRGLVWASVARVGKTVVQFGISVVLARLLVPADFGLVSMLAVIIGLSVLVTELGLGAALIQRKDLRPEHLSTAFWANLALATVACTLIFLGAPLVVAFYEEPRLLNITRVISVTLVLGSLSIVPRAILKRDMDFKTLAQVEILQIGLGGAIAVGFAFAGQGVWALVAQALFNSGFKAAYLHYRIRWYPTLSFDREAFRDLWGFGRDLLGVYLLNYFSRNIDNLLIGKFAGSAQLGLYGRAYSTMLLPLRQVTQVSTKVMFPAMASIQDQPERLRAVYLQTLRGIGFLTFPLVVGLFVTAEWFVVGLYGEKWREAVALVQILCLISIKQPLSATAGLVFTSLGRNDIQLRWQAVVSLVGLIAFALGVPWGALGVTCAYVIRGWVLHYPQVMIPGRLVGVGFIEYHANVMDSFLCAVVMGTVVYGFSLVIPEAWHPLLKLLVSVGVGCTVYMALVAGLAIRPYREVRELVVRRWTKRTRR